MKTQVFPSETTQEYAQSCVMCMANGVVWVGNISRFDVLASVKSALYLLS
jgi:hypothetical protein